MNSPVAPELQESMALISIYWKSILHITTVSMSFFYRSVRHISVLVSGCPLRCLGMASFPDLSRRFFSL